MWKDEGLMCIFQCGSRLKKGVGEKSEERLKRSMDDLMLLFRLSCEGKVWEMPNNQNISSQNNVISGRALAKDFWNWEVL